MLIMPRKAEFPADGVDDVLFGRVGATVWIHVLDSSILFLRFCRLASHPVATGGVGIV